MADASNNEMLMKVVSRILEDAAFIFTNSLEDAAKPVCGSWNAQGASLEFSGPTSGKLHMWAADGFSRYAAANMLGIEEGGADKKGMDALKELLNMIAGNFLTAQFGTTPVFSLGIPRELAPQICAADCASDDAIWLEAEGNIVMFRLIKS